MSYGSVPDWAPDPLLWAACDVGLGRSYGHTGDETQNCIRQVFATMSTLRPDADLASRSKVLHLNIEDGLGSFAHLDAYVDAGVAEHVDALQMGEDHIMQGWRQTSSGLRGHTLIIRVAPASFVGDTIWRLDATNATPDWFRPTTWADLEDFYHHSIRLVRVLDGR